MLPLTETKPSVSLAGRRILVLEDEYFLADDIRRVLASSGASVIGPFNEVADAAEFLDSDAPVDAAILDINLRSEMVFPLARALRARGIPFVFTTGYDRGSIDPEFHEVALWEKPLVMTSLLRSLGAMMGKA